MTNPTTEGEPLLSKEAQQKLAIVQKDFVEKFKALKDGSGTIEKTYVNAQVDKAIDIIANDFDAADGKVDGRISRNIAITKGSQILKMLPEGVIKNDPEFQQVLLAKLGTANDIAVSELADPTKKAAHKLVDITFKAVDTVVEDGKIDKQEFDAAKLKIDKIIERGIELRLKHDPECDGTCKMPGVPDVRPVIPLQK